MIMQNQKAPAPNNIEPIKVVKSISRWIKGAIAQQSILTEAHLQTWADALDHLAGQLESPAPNAPQTDAPLDANYAERLRHDAAWVVAELCTKANKYAFAEEAKENDLAGQALIATLNALTIGVCRPTTQIINIANGNEDPKIGA